MGRTLTPDSNLDTLKKDAKRWLKALRAGDASAKQRLLAATPDAPAEPGLRDVQFALAREYGLAGWAALRQALDDLALARRSRAEHIAIVLGSAWEGDRSAAIRILTRWPEIGSADLFTAAATGDRATVERCLAADPDAARRPGGPRNWEPLLYLAYARLPGDDAAALDVARLLLDHGADPNASFNDGWDNPFKVLTGVIGQGEGDKAAHPHARDLAQLLIERGADPYDSQALYNTSITRDDTTWLDVLWTESERRGRLAAWREVEGTKIGGNVPMNTLDYLLGNAVAFNHLARAEWLLRHGANANGPHAYSARALREEALVYGHRAMADLLVRYGAATPPLTGQSAFDAACMALDRDAARALAQQHPDYLQDAALIHEASRQGRADVVALLLELGVPVDVMNKTENRPLHSAVMGGSMALVRLLVAHGADIDRPTTQYGGAMGFAAEFRRYDIAAELAPLSRDVWNMTYLGVGMTDRLRDLFTAEPALVNAVHPRGGMTPLFCLPDDDDQAFAMASLLLAHGADPTIRNKSGDTAVAAARRRGLLDAADLMHGDNDD
jgi:ankyrin repeat protein